MDTELEQQPGYYSILTASVRYDKDLNANEKILFSEITALSNKHGYCTASNNYFAEPTLSLEGLDKIFNSFGKSENT